MKIYTVKQVKARDGFIYRVERNYKNGNSKLIGRDYQTMEGARGMARHRNACHLDRYGVDTIERV